MTNLTFLCVECYETCCIECRKMVDVCECHIETGRTQWGVKYATLGPWRVLAYPEGGSAAFMNVNGMGWIVADDDMPESIFDELLAAMK
jgi:hypothetical protein